MSCENENNNVRLLEERLRDYLEKVIKAYPVDNNLSKMIQLKDKLDKILSGEEVDYEIDDNLILELDDLKKGRAKREIPESDNGFDLDEVLNPGKLDLEDLCVELGLMEK